LKKEKRGENESLFSFSRQPKKSALLAFLVNFICPIQAGRIGIAILDRQRERKREKEVERERERDGERERQRGRERQRQKRSERPKPKKTQPNPDFFFSPKQKPNHVQMPSSFYRLFSFRREKTSIHISEQTNKQSREQGKNGGV
jgi:hypothetical protein